MTANLYLQDMPLEGVHAFKQPFMISDGVGKNIRTESTKVVVVMSLYHDPTPVELVVADTRPLFPYP
jgi:hypothetical protein